MIGCAHAEAIVVEPIATDARMQGDGRDSALLKLLSGLFEVDLDRLRQRTQTQQAIAETQRVIAQQQRRMAETQRGIAEQQRELSNRRQKVALARQLAAQADRIRVEQPGALDLAALLAVEAARRLDTLETQQALRSACCRCVHGG